ncbi:F-BAR and double SH3 domains protein 2 isoform X2 [Ceratitis capitata]|uniref:F-BAR and double SH3 domains protein 2 isoform X2 n=1 Tax=Ceratitis capitata TaxID=7213 RepID=UPI000A101639|nr:F-BAR and double SH3 domains protein 2 isoform X2 [Ceratitis capitata]XP_020718211.1 F-BAR and double SH3 domains protein 2 isoform X2 [Ceratitis capitata]XP_020718212.1 F-BAR and double SH3 domains protein 2 isoform X2 [Ceratitis capitata]
MRTYNTSIYTRTESKRREGFFVGFAAKMSHFRDNSWPFRAAWKLRKDIFLVNKYHFDIILLTNSRSKSVLKSLRCRSSRRSKSKSKSSVDISASNQNGGEANYVQNNGDEKGQNGFEELRRYVKQGGDFGKELIMILQERVESETLYSKSLSKMANKLNKACRELPGSIADAWRGVATEMENRSDIHRQLSASLTDEIVKPLKNIIDAHHKTRKSVESNVDKAARTLAEWRVSESKAKKSSHTAARENEKLQDALLDVRIQKSPSIALLHQGPNKLAAEKEIRSAEKDCAKLDSKRKKAEEAVKRADVEYYTLCIRAERARVDWEMAVLRGSSLLQNIENQRLVNMKNFIANYSRLTSNMNPILDGLMQRLQPQVDACNVLKDMQVVKNIRRNSEGPSEQLLPDFYCEHTTLAMNRERRKHALIKLLQLVKADLERERRSRNGLKGLSQSLNNQENQNITDKLYHIRSMLTYLEGARFKLHSALLELDHKPRSSHPLAQHIQVTRDRTGLQQSVLKVPLWLKNNDRVGQDDNSSMQENEYECIPQSNNNISNASCTDLSKDMLIRKFNRSKSNIETLSNKTQLCIASIDKTKTIPAHIDDPYSDRGQADGGSNQQDSDFDEFSSQDEDDDDEVEQTTTTTAQSTGRKEHKAIIEKSTMLANGTATAMSNGATPTIYQNATEVQNGHQTHANGNANGAPVILSRCKALYSYTPKLYDELELTPGDIIEVHAKQDDGWWLGALGNHVGIFPATYVEEFE